ncbi:hypothetical protein Pelo_11249 [Pelomyxa schiedti]|nr:hypothetical protein Pelo_11249 [Pelomyxa schiedti]
MDCSTSTSPDTTPIKVVVVRSHTGSKKCWDHLRTHSRDFGDRPLTITYQKEFTLETLIRANPDVIVCSDPAGAPYQYTTAEVNALSSYINQNCSRHLFGTYATFYHKEGPTESPHIYDNRALASLFGLDPDIFYTTRRLSTQPKYFPELSSRNSLLWKNIPFPYISGGYASSQIPDTGTPNTWFENTGALSGASPDCSVLAKTLDGSCVVLNYVCERFTSLYISHMPEYESARSSHDDLQLLYNVIVFLYNQGKLNSLSNRCLELVARNIRNYPQSSIKSLPVDIQQRVYSTAFFSTGYPESTKEFFADFEAPQCHVS